MSETAPRPEPAPPRRPRAKPAAEAARRIQSPRDEAGGHQRLIEQALILFAEKGFDSVTVRDIAAASKVSVGLINHHFGSKEGLREAVDAHFIKQFEEALNPGLPSNLRSVEDYSTWVDEWIGRHQGDWNVTVSYFRRALLDDTEWGGSLFSRFYRIVQSSVMQMDARGEIRPDVDRLWLPFLLIFMELGTTLLDPHIKRVLGRSGFEPDLWRRRHRAYIDLLRNGVAPKH